MAADANQLLTVPDVAERLNCSSSFIYEAIAKGELRHYRLGKAGLRVSEGMLAEYLRAREGGSTRQPTIEPAPKLQAGCLRRLTLN